MSEHSLLASSHLDKSSFPAKISKVKRRRRKARGRRTGRSSSRTSSEVRDGGDGRGLPVLSMGGAGRHPGRPRVDLLPEVRAARGLQGRRRGAEAAGALAGGAYFGGPGGPAAVVVPFRTHAASRRFTAR